MAKYGTDVIKCYCSPKTKQELRELAKNSSKTESDILREALKNYMQKPNVTR